MSLELDDHPAAGAARSDDGRADGVARRRRPGPAWAWPMVLVVLVAVGAGFRLWALGVHRLNYDESFTAVAGRMSLARMVTYLRIHDSHPPLDYLLHAPIARAGASELFLRLPSALCSIGALALFAWWVRRRGVAGVVATGLMAVSAFQIVHGREARMYADMELIGVATAVLVDRWLRRPRNWHAPALAALVLAGLLTHVSMFLLGFGLLLLPGLRRDAHAWRWRGAIAAAGVGWAVLWGPTFWVQAQGGHSTWIAPTSFNGLSAALGRLVVPGTQLRLAILALVAIGAVVLARRDRTLGRVWTYCFLVPVAAGAIAGLFVPVIIDRTFTVVAWAPLLALGFIVDDLARWWRPLAVAAFAVAAFAMVPIAVHTVTVRSGPDTVLRRLASDVRPGDTVAIFPAWRQPELAWSIGVRGKYPSAPAHLALRDTSALTLGPARPTGRLWLLDWRPPGPPLSGYRQCAPTWRSGNSRILCLVPATPSSSRAG